MAETPTILTGTHAGVRDERTHIERRHDPVSPPEATMTAEQFAELKAMLEPISEIAKLILAERADAEAKAESKKGDKKGS